MKIVSVNFEPTPQVEIDCGNFIPVVTINDGKVLVTCSSDVINLPNTLPLGIYVSPTGTPQGNGSPENPIDIFTALKADSIVKAGDNVWLRAGTYSYQTGFTANLHGIAGKPINVSAFPGERVILSAPYNANSVLTVNGAWVNFKDLEITCPDVDRTKDRVTGFAVYGANTKFINLIVHDVGSGCGLWVPAVDCEVYGCIFYNNGWQGVAPDRGHGHNLYVQNDTGTKKIFDNISCNSYGYGFHGYAQSNPLRGLRLDGNIIFNSGTKSTPLDTDYSNILIGGIVPADDVSVTNNYLYHPQNVKNTVNASFFFTNEQNGAITFQNNYVAGGSQNLWLQGWKHGDVSGNTFISSQNLLTVGHSPGTLFNAFVWNNNSYFGTAAQPFLVRPTTGFYLRDFPGWKTETGYDNNSTFSNLPTTNKIVLRKNQYDSKRAHLAIFNWQKLINVPVDLSSVLNTGDSFEVRDVLNLFGQPIVSGTYQGGQVQIPTPNEFSAFLVLKTS